MDEVITAIRRAIIDEEEADEMISTSTSGEEARAKPIPEAGLLSREATAAVGSTFNTLTETVKKHEPSQYIMAALIGVETVRGLR
jgi:hypothetical protein